MKLFNNHTPLSELEFAHHIRNYKQKAYPAHLVSKTASWSKDEREDSQRWDEWGGWYKCPAREHVAANLAEQFTNDDWSRLFNVLGFTCEDDMEDFHRWGLTWRMEGYLRAVAAERLGKAAHRGKSPLRHLLEIRRFAA